MGLGVIVVVMVVFCQKVPDGEKFLADSLAFLFGKETMGPSGMVPYLVLAGVVLCLLVAGMCILVTSRLAGKITATLKTLRRAADNLRDGELDFQILSCDLRELDELSQSLESVRQRLKASALAEAGAQEERGLLMANLSHDLRTPHHRHQRLRGGDPGRHRQHPGKAAALSGHRLQQVPGAGAAGAEHVRLLRVRAGADAVPL